MAMAEEGWEKAPYFRHHEQHESQRSRLSEAAGRLIQAGSCAASICQS